MPAAYKVAFSYAGELSALVVAIAEEVRKILGPDTVFFAEWYVSEIAGYAGKPDLQKIYGPHGATLVVECLSPEQQHKEWTRIESEAIAQRRAHDDGAVTVLPLEVAAGGNTKPFETIAPVAYRLKVPDTARLIVDRLRLVESTNGAPHAVAAAPGLDTVYVTDFVASQTLIRNALALYQSRLPEDERYDLELMVDIVRRHLSNEFAPTWTAHLLISVFAKRTVGMLLCYEHLVRNLAFVSYLVAYNPRLPGMHPPDIGQDLAEHLMTARTTRGLPPGRFLFEVDDPALALNPRERRRRASRLELFGTLAPFKALHLRALDIAYLQPNLEGTDQAGERPLLLCYAAPGLGETMSREASADLLTWTYTELYDGIFEEPEKAAAYTRYTRQLSERVVSGLPDQVRLLKHGEAGRRRRDALPRR